MVKVVFNNPVAADRSPILTVAGARGPLGATNQIRANPLIGCSLHIATAKRTVRRIARIRKTVVFGPNDGLASAPCDASAIFNLHVSTKRKFLQQRSFIVKSCNSFL